MPGKFAEKNQTKKDCHLFLKTGEGKYTKVFSPRTKQNKKCYVLSMDLVTVQTKACSTLNASRGERTACFGSFSFTLLFFSNFPQHAHGYACSGHDGHVTMLLGAAALLKKVEDQIVGTIRLVFQPAEEGGAGMKRMIEEGLVSMEPKALEAYGMHVWPTLPTGSIATRSGALLAAAETFEIQIMGKGGHAAMPHLTIDPIVAGSALVQNLQTIVSRTLSPLEAGVVSVTQFTAGDAYNVIPAAATMRGTIRALSNELLLTLRKQVHHMVTATALLHGCNSTIRFSPDYYPPTMNDEKLFDWSKLVGALVSRESVVRDIEPTMGGEDFSFLAQELPSAFMLVGQGSGGMDNEKYHIPRTDYGLHHPSFALDENVLPIGSELHTNLALRALKRLSQTDADAADVEL